MAHFYFKYFPFPLFRDEGLQFYEAFGKCFLTDDMSWNPFKLWRGFRALRRRMITKKINGTIRGEGRRTGGFLIFGADGEPKYIYKEKPGLPLDEKRLSAALNAVRAEGVAASVQVELSDTISHGTKATNPPNKQND